MSFISTTLSSSQEAIGWRGDLRHRAPPPGAEPGRAGDIHRNGQEPGETNLCRDQVSASSMASAKAVAHSRVWERLIRIVT
ncbi:hypothetical protein DSECCO2_462780 [anaerobic digester metagenome]